MSGKRVLFTLLILLGGGCDNQTRATDPPREPGPTAGATEGVVADAAAEPAAEPATADARLPLDGSAITLERDQRAATADGRLTLRNLGVGYAHLTDGGNLADAHLAVTLDGEASELRLFREGPDDPEASQAVGPYTITLEGVEAYSAGSATVVVTRGE